MINVRKILFLISIIFGILYAIDILFHFTFFFSYLHTHSLLEHIFAFLIGMSSFINMFLYPHIHTKS